jgi:Spy/CpxP family protein refolding chaperone
MKIATVGVLWFTLIVCLARPLGAQSRLPVQGRPVLKELGLTPLQRRQLMELRRGRRFGLAQVNREVQGHRRELAELYRAYPLDEAKATSLIQQIVQLETTRMRLQLQNQLELRRILTREQFFRFTQLTETAPRFVPLVPPPARGPGP